jgi:hypothetical protein
VNYLGLVTFESTNQMTSYTRFTTCLLFRHLVAPLYYAAILKRSVLQNIELRPCASSIHLRGDNHEK